MTLQCLFIIWCAYYNKKNQHFVPCSNDKITQKEQERKRSSNFFLQSHEIMHSSEVFFLSFWIRSLECDVDVCSLFGAISWNRLRCLSWQYDYKTRNKIKMSLSVSCICVVFGGCWGNARWENWLKTTENVHRICQSYEKLFLANKQMLHLESRPVINKLSFQFDQGNYYSFCE